MIHKYVRPIRKKLVIKKSIKIEYRKDYYLLSLDSHKIRVSINDMSRLGDWIRTHGKTIVAGESENN